MSSIPIAVAYGDGIGPEIMNATLKILEASGAKLDLNVIEIGEKVYEKGYSSGITDQSWNTLEKTKVFLKAPITTPQGGGFKSLNVTVRKTLGLYANVRPCVSYYPYVATKHPNMDVVIVRENEEDLYAGIEHRQTHEVYQTLKLISIPGSEKIIRYAFEYAIKNNRKKVTCFTKDNIMKLSDGIFHKIFEDVAKEYPQIENEHWIVDIGAAKLADTPEVFDVIVMPNLYGDILSDVAAQIAGSVGLAGSANIGDEFAMFEAIHGSAPRRAGQNLANPSGLLLAGVQMLVHIGLPKEAEKVHNAWLTTLEEGIHTYDIYKENISHKKVGTKEFADAVIANLGKYPTKLKPVHYEAESHAKKVSKSSYSNNEAKTLNGVDVFIEWDEHNRNPNKLAEIIEAIDYKGNLKLKIISNRGLKVWPKSKGSVFCCDHWRVRFESDNTIEYSEVIKLLTAFNKAKLDVIKTENLCSFNGVKGYSLSQGE